MTGEALLLPLSVLVLVGVWYGCFFLANHEIRAAKAAGGWYEGLHQGIAVDTGLRTDPPRFPWLWLAPALIVTVATAVIGVVSYPSMPATARGALRRERRARQGGRQVGRHRLFPGVRADRRDRAARRVSRRPSSGGRPDIDPAHPVGSARWHRRYMSLGAKALLGLVAMIDLGMLGSSLLMWTGTVTPWAPLVVVIPILAAVVVAVVVLARHNRERFGASEDTGLTHRDDDKYWRGGLFYVNREDHALMVPRRFGLGWALNFGNPRAAMLLAGVVALISMVVILRLDG